MKRIFGVLAGFAAVLVVCGIGFVAFKPTHAEDTYVKQQIRGRIHQRYCAYAGPCLIPDVQSAEWQLSPGETRNWSVSVEVPRASLPYAVKKGEWEVVGEMQVWLAGTFRGPQASLERTSTKGVGFYPSIVFWVSAYEGWERLNRVEDKWTVAPKGNLRQDIELTLNARGAAAKVEGRAAAMLIRLEADRGDPEKAVEMVASLAKRHPPALAAIKEEVEKLAAKVTYGTTLREKFAHQAAGL